MHKILFCIVFSVQLASVCKAVSAQDILDLAPHERPQAALDGVNDFWLQQYPAPATLAAPAGATRTFETATLPGKLLAKAEVDGCHFGIGDPRNADTLPPCGPEGQRKVNGSYVWGMAKQGDNLWWGTLANAVCTVAVDTGLPEPSTENSAYVCEGAAGQVPPGVDGLRDWREPQIHSYDLATDEQFRYQLQGTDLDNLRATTGLRAVGAARGVVLLGGPAHSENVIYIFAFNGQSGDFLGSARLADYDNIRSITRIRSELYLAVSDPDIGGAILRWSGDETSPFQFETVGTVDGQGAFIAEHEGRLFVSTWPSLSGLNLLALQTPGIFMSEPLQQGGYLPPSTNPLTNVFRFSQYEPDLVTSISYAGGAMASYNGYLYFGTMHFPASGALAAYLAHELCSVSPACDYNLDADNDGELGDLELLGAFLGTYRATSVFRGQNFAGGTPDIELLYGNPVLPVYDPDSRTYLNIEPNNMPDPNPEYGFSGFNDFFNLYSWTMAVHQDSLYVGTFDWSYLVGASFFDTDALTDLLDSVLDPDVIGNIDPDLVAQLRLPVILPGADIFRFDDTSSAAQVEAVAGVGNIANYGVRTMVADENLWIGTANPMNLLVNEPPVQGLEVSGGWEVIQLDDNPLRSAQMVPVFGGFGVVILSALLTLLVWRRKHP